MKDADIPQDVTAEFAPAVPGHAALREVKEYWTRKRGDRRMPARGDIHPAEMKKCLPQVLLADVLPDATDFRYRLVGSRLRPYFPVEATGQLFSVALAPFGPMTVAATLAAYRSVVENRAPLLLKGPGTYFAQESKYFEAILMPLGEDGMQPNMIFGAFEFDWQRPAE